MWKPSLLAPSLALLTLGAAQTPQQPLLPLAGAAMWIECVQGGEVVVRIEAESDEPLREAKVFGPDGSLLLEVTAARSAGVKDFKAEIPFESLEDLLRTGQEGEHEIRGTTLSGRRASGRASLSLAMPRAPVVLVPRPGSKGASSQDLTVMWVSGEARASTYLELEQGESDGLTVTVPAGQDSFRVPKGVLRPETATHLEVATIDPSGNRMVVEVPFFTR